MNLMTVSNICRASDEEKPGMDFLEFLGEGIVVEGEYLDPVNYADIDHKAAYAQKNNSSDSSTEQEVSDDE